MIPEDFLSSKYPDKLDDDQNLFLVHDSLSVKLAEDYDPNTDTSIEVSGDISLFPPTGIITLTEQCSDAKDRAVTLFYMTKTASGFTGLIPEEGFENTIVRPKGLTHVTQNVVDRHHNAIKDAIIAIEEFAGLRGTVDTEPLGPTMDGRINFLRKLVLTPRAWFTAKNKIGLVPLEVTFKNECFRLGEGEIIYTWDFGDQSSNVSVSTYSTISTTSVVPISDTNVYVVDTDGGTIVKKYETPGKYRVRLTVQNKYGTDTVEFEDFITARIEAPDEAIIEFSGDADQIFTDGDPVNGPYTTPPTVRSRVNRNINLSIPEGINGTTLRTYGGEEVVGIVPVDPIETYSWILNDDAEHANVTSTQAYYSIGGIYDLVLRCDTKYGGYRITTYANAIDIVEEKNLWLFTHDDSDTATPNEFGLISETFKTGSTSYSILRDSSFLNDTNNESQGIREFNRNTGFALNGSVTSGNRGSSILVYAGGGAEGSLLSEQVVKTVDYEGFSGTLTDNDLEIQRPWNWVFLAFESKSYFLFGPEPNAVPLTNESYQIKDIMDLGGILTLETPVELVNPDNYVNGAQELMEHVTADYDLDPISPDYQEPESGRFAVYRSAKRANTGFMMRNDGAGVFFKLNSFYKTEGIASDPVINIRKLPDMVSTKTEGQLVGLSNGIFFFNNSGNLQAYNVVSGVWEGANSVSPFKNFQDTSVDDYDDKSNTLLATSDGEYVAYLSYDYSSNSFIKYNSVDFVFSSIGSRPEGSQWLMGIY